MNLHLALLQIKLEFSFSSLLSLSTKAYAPAVLWEEQ